MQIQGHTALVTGAASGLGEATARELARLGAKVAVLDVNAAMAAQVAEQLNTQHGAGTAIACHCDITQTDSVQAALDAATAALAALFPFRDQFQQVGQAAAAAAVAAAAADAAVAAASAAASAEGPDAISRVCCAACAHACARPIRRGPARALPDLA